MVFQRFILEKDMVSYTHQCSISTQIEFGQPFTYNLIDQETQHTYFWDDFELTLRDPHDVLNCINLEEKIGELYSFLRLG